MKWLRDKISRLKSEIDRVNQRRAEQAENKPFDYDGYSRLFNEMFGDKDRELIADYWEKLRPIVESLPNDED